MRVVGWNVIGALLFVLCACLDPLLIPMDGARISFVNVEVVAK